MCQLDFWTTKLCMQLPCWKLKLLTRGPCNNRCLTLNVCHVGFCFKGQDKLTKYQSKVIHPSPPPFFLRRCPIRELMIYYKIHVCRQKSLRFLGQGRKVGLPLRSKILIEHVLLSAYCSVVYVLTSCLKYIIFLVYSIHQ